jgi:single-strand DNA-binding protein
MVNEVTLVGYTGRDIEARSTQSGQLIGSLSVATTEDWKDKNTGDKKSKTEWHRVVIFREQTTKFLQQYAPAGSLVMVKGSNQTRKWTDKDGVDRYTTEVAVGGFKGSVTLLMSKDRASKHDPETGEVPQHDGIPGLVDDEIPF